MAEQTFKFEDKAGQTFELTAAEVECKVFAHRNVQHTRNLSPTDIRGVSWFCLWPQDDTALEKLREVEVDAQTGLMK